MAGFLAVMRTTGLGAALFWLALAGANADEASPQAASASVSPEALSSQDAARYRQIFEAERAGRFEKAEALFAKVDDKCLQGYVEAERYLSPHGGRTPVKTLVRWLEKYRDLPIAERIYRLAVKRSTRRVRRRHRTVVYAVVTGIPAPASMPHLRGGGYEDVNLPDPPLASDIARAAQAQINAAIKADNPDQAMAVLQPLIDARSAPQSDIARLSQRVAASYFAEGMDQKAYDLASREADDDGGRQSAPLLDWNAGLSGFRLGLYHDAAAHFETLAQVGSVANWVRSAASFWAARAHMRANEPERVVTLLNFAAREEPTFYGLLAEQLLGRDTESGFSDPVLTQTDLSQFMQIPPAHRAVALWQAGEYDDVGEELSRAFAAIDMKQDPAFAALARALNVPSLELRASETSASRGIMLTGLFPVPQYKPDGGYTIDPALVLAIARAESRFHADAISSAGARGLMQLMPATAVHIGGPGAAERLTDPAYNMTVGQRYVGQLLDMYNGNLVELCAAYNAGPLKVSNWMAAREGKGDDALLFIESMRAPETRFYVKRLLTYHWMYRRRLGLEATALRDMAAGVWPTYKPPRQPAPPPPPTATPEEDNAAAID
jgi:soluble lytic murein transglycosylase-like protein